MKAQVVMISDRGVVSALTANGDYVVLFLEGSGEMELGDHIALDDSGGHYKDIRNVTKNQKVRVTIHEMECTEEQALGYIQNLNSPEKVFFFRRG